LIEIVSALIHSQRSPLVYYMLLTILIIYFVKKRNGFEMWVLEKPCSQRDIFSLVDGFNCCCSIYDYESNRAS